MWSYDYNHQGHKLKGRCNHTFYVQIWKFLYLIVIEYSLNVFDCMDIVLNQFICLILTAFQLDFEIIRTIASFIKISSGHSLIIKLIFIKFFRTIGEIGGQMSWDQCIAESLIYANCKVFYTINWSYKYLDGSLVVSVTL